ncbi:MAG: hypothetical protein WDZ94_01740 [Patescibacteria group bacterium]
MMTDFLPLFGIAVLAVVGSLFFVGLYFVLNIFAHQYEWLDEEPPAED